MEIKLADLLQIALLTVSSSIFEFDVEIVDRNTNPISRNLLNIITIVIVFHKTLDNIFLENG